MTLLHVNGLEAPKRGAVINGVGAYTNSGRTGRYCRFTPGNSIAFPVGSLAEGVIFGGAFRWNGRFITASAIRIVGTAGDELVFGPLNNDSGVMALRRNAVLIATATAGASLDVWHYIEIRAKVHDTLGVAKVRIDGVEVVNFAGDTKDSSVGNAAAVTSINISGGSGGSGGNIDVDDVYVCDTVDATATQLRPYNDFLGPVRVEPRYPSGNGASSAWVGSDGNSVDNYALVDETPPSDVDYVSTSVAAARDLYTYPALAMPVGTVLAVDVCPYAHTPDAGTAVIKSVVRDAAGTVVVGPGTNPGITSALVSDKLHTAAPDGGVWTIAKANAAQFGIEAG